MQARLNALMARDEWDTLAKRVKGRRQLLKLNQEQLAALSGLGQGDISKIERGDSQQTTKIAQLARALECDAFWLATGKDEESHSSVFAVAESPAAYGMTPILAWEHADELPPGEFVLVPRLDVLLSAGNGHEQIELKLTQECPEAFRADWIRAMRLKPNKLAAMHTSGESMEPTIHDGDSVLVDISQTKVLDGNVYALWYEGGERVKRLFTLPGGGLRIASDNPRHQPIDLAPERAGDVRIIGRVVHRSGMGGL